MKEKNTEVVIIGGSLVGLSASVFLSWRGIKNIVIEKHKASLPHPRAMGFTEHTLEFFRAVGIEDKIPQVDPGVRLRRIRVESLAGVWKDETLWTPGKIDDKKEKFSPSNGAAIPQDKLEPILRARALELGSELSLGTEMTEFQQYSDQIMVSIRNRDSGETQKIYAKYMIAADGGDSSVRESLGIHRKGIGYLQTVRSVLFSCPEADTFLDRGFQQFEIEQPNFKAFLTTYHDGRWVLMFSDDRERSEDELKSAILLALGKGMEFKIITTGRWEMKGLIAEKYSSRQVFLVGDAAHQLPPTRGGFGANTGIDDAYNLAWKLEFVLKGLSSEKILDTYSEERQPIGWLRHEQTFARPDYHRYVGHKVENIKLYDDVEMELGQLLKSSAIIGATADLPPAANPNLWSGQPGVRAPHAWITYRDKKVSVVDLFTHSFVLISEDPIWREIAKVAAEKTGIPITAFIVGEDVRFSSSEEFEKLYGVESDGASLIRPDGVISWRSVKRSTNSEHQFIKAVASISCSLKFGGAD